MLNILKSVIFNRSELVGTAGVVKIRLDEEVPSPTPTTPASIKRFVYSMPYKILLNRANIDV